MKADKKSTIKDMFIAFSPLWLFAVLVAVYGLSLSALNASKTAAMLCTLAPFAVWSVGCLFLKAKGTLNLHHVYAVVMFLAVAVRVYYILATPWNYRQHDVFVFETQGHAGYIFTMMKTGELPETNTGLFYHPPLHPYLMSVAGNVLSRAINTTEQVFETLQLLPAYYSLICGFVFLKILSVFKIRQSTKLLFFTAFIMHPSLIIFSGSINNDILCLLLTLCAVLYLLRFWEKQSLKNALLMGIFLGLAMMTKVSAVTIAPVIAGVFVLRLIKPSENRTRKSVLVNELCFGAVSIPLGMWYPIRNLIKFNQPFGYVMPIGKEHALYCGDKSFFERYIALPLKQLFENPYCMPEDDYNIPIYTVKCSAFGEFSFAFPKWAAVMLLVLNCMIITFCITAAIYTFKKRNPHGVILTSVSIISLVFFAWFNLQYPNGCSMDFRYISVCLCALAPAAMCFDSISSKRVRYIASFPIILFTALTLCLYLSEELFII